MQELSAAAVVLWLPAMMWGMTWEQATLFALMGGVLALLLWGRWRYDLVAFGALVLAVIIGVVDTKQAFSGFGHPAVIIIALVLVISRGLERAGVVEMITRHLVDARRGIAAHIAIMGGIGAALSAFMNNVAALAMLMPVDMQAAARAGRAAARTLMPLSFATILGGMTTLIGTPTNIVIAQFREQALGAPYLLFDFAPVGLGVAVAGLLFLALIGWRLIPVREHGNRRGQQEPASFIVELVVGEQSAAIGRSVQEVKEEAAEAGALLIGVVRRGQRQRMAKNLEIRKGDVLLLESAPEGVEQFAAGLKLDFSRSRKHAQLLADSMDMMEVVVPREARITNRSADDLRLLARHGVVLAGISRHGRRIDGRVRKEPVRSGDVLLLVGPETTLEETVRWLGGLPLKRREMPVAQRQKAWLAMGMFAAAVLASALGLVYLPVALGAVVVGYALVRIIPLSRIYDAIEWPVIVLLASLIPIGAALESSGGTALIAQGLLWLTDGLSPVLVLIVIMIITMTLSDMLNNVATVLVAAPVAVQVANALQVNPDTMLMGVAVAASCAFLTPIGHKNNTIIMGPGGYAFGDYWRLGLPLELIVLAVSVPLLLIAWPL